jgi:hypothetical protein
MAQSTIATSPAVSTATGIENPASGDTAVILQLIFSRSSSTATSMTIAFGHHFSMAPL